MAGVGGFRGVPADQDARFSNKQKRLMKDMKFPKELDVKVNLNKVHWPVMKEWIAKRVTELLGLEEEVLISFIYNQLEDQKVNGKELHINLVPFLEKNTNLFCKELWTLLASANQNESGIPQAFLDAKQEELRLRREQDEKLQAHLNQKREEAERMRAEAAKKAEEVAKKDQERDERDKGRTGPSSRDADRERDDRRDRHRSRSPDRRDDRRDRQDRDRSPDRRDERRDRDRDRGYDRDRERDRGHERNDRDRKDRERDARDGRDARDRERDSKHDDRRDRDRERDVRRQRSPEPPREDVRHARKRSRSRSKSPAPNVPAPSARRPAKQDNVSPPRSPAREPVSGKHRERPEDPIDYERKEKKKHKKEKKKHKKDKKEKRHKERQEAAGHGNDREVHSDEPVSGSDLDMEDPELAELRDRALQSLGSGRKSSGGDAGNDEWAT